MKWIKT